MDEFALLAALGPLTIYLLLVGVVLCMRRPFVTTAARDFGALGVGIAGMIFVGPIQLFFPSMSMATFGLWTWIMLITFYLLSLSLIAANMRPRLMVYGCVTDDVRKALYDATRQLDATSQQDADSVYLPTRRVRLRVESARGRSCSEVILVSGVITQRDWDQLIGMLRRSLADAQPHGRTSGIILLVTALVLAGLLTGVVVEAPREVVDGLRAFIRR